MDSWSLRSAAEPVAHRQNVRPQRDRGRICKGDLHLPAGYIPGAGFGQSNQLQGDAYRLDGNPWSSQPGEDAGKLPGVQNVQIFPFPAKPRKWWSFRACSDRGRFSAARGRQRCQGSQNRCSWQSRSLLLDQPPAQIDFVVRLEGEQHSHGRARPQLNFPNSLCA